MEATDIAAYKKFNRRRTKDAKSIVRKSRILREKTSYLNGNWLIYNGIVGEIMDDIKKQIDELKKNLIS